MPAPGGISGVSIQGDVTAGQQYVPRATAMLRRLSERVELAGVSVASDFVRLDDNAYCYGIVAGGLRRAVIVVDTDQPSAPQASPARTPVRVPDFYSGCVVDGRVTTPAPDPITHLPRPDYVDNFWPSAACAALFGLSPDEQTSTKLAVDPYSEFAGDLEASAESNFHYSQYVRLRPTMYSGRMRQVVQFLMGYGKQVAAKSLYDRTKPKLTTAAQSREQPTLYQSDVARLGVQIRYDWRWYRTHGIGVGQDGKLWLVEIGSTRGAIAMPLPMNADTQTPAFRDKLSAMHDAAGVAVLDEFGGFPTGESLPASALESWIRAGKVVRLATTEDMQEFYDLNTFSSVMGWAFNRSGNEAHNVANFLAEDGIWRSSHYGFSITIGATRAVTPPADAPRARAAIASKSKDVRYAAVTYKLDLMPQADLEFILAGAINADDLFEALDAYTVVPLAAASGALWLETTGKLYKLGRLAQYNLKYPWPEVGYLVSFDMQPVGNPKAPHCDTDVHVFYVGDELKIVRWFYDPRSATPAAVEDDSDGCLLAGAFTRTTQSGSMHLPNVVYSADFDDRRELVGARTITLTKGRDLGYCRVQVVDDIISPYLGHLSRYKRFRRDIDTQSWSGEGVDAAMVMPFWDRCAYYYAVNQSKSAYSHATSTSYPEIVDPWSCNTWRNFPGYTGSVINGVFRRAQHPDGCGPVDYRCVRSPAPVYSGYFCADFADSGEWCFVCDNAETMLYSIPAPPTPPSTFTTTGFNLTRTVHLVNETDHSPLLVSIETFTDPFGGFAYPWFVASPDPDTGDTQYADVTHNAFGDGDAMRYWDRPNGSVLDRGEPAPPSFPGVTPTFIGVVP